MKQFRMAYYSIPATLLCLALAGCAPSSASRPDASLTPPPPAGGPGASKSGSAGEGTRGATKEANTPTPSSLDQLREGKSSATAATSPLKDVYFDYDRYDLRGDAREVLRANADWLKSNPAARVEIEGHCDDRGTNEYNLALGAKRAQSAKEYLSSLGIVADRISTISYGAEIPVCKEQTEGCWRQNRRARFVVLQSKPAS